NKLYGENCDEKIKQRFDFEISIIKKMGYIDFYLITYDFINYAKKNKIAVGPGRGSGAGSIIAYCMGITGIDPIKYNLLFERFLNPERITMPDFDIDFCYENRQRVIDYVNNKYGIDRVCQIITFGTMAARAVIRDVGRVMGLPYSLCDKISKMIPREINITIEKALFLNHDLKNEYEQDEKVKQLIDYSKSLEGMPRHASTHAAGVVVTPKPVVEFVPLQKNDEAIVTQFTKETVEELGLLKIDFLGLRTLTAIDKTVNQILKTHLDFDIEKIPYDDVNIYNMLSKGDSNCVFQFESAGMKRVLTLLKPETIEDLIAVISLYRPGPMDSIPKYIKNKHSKQQITYKHPLLKPILEVTYGCVVYQEQVMEICRNLAGFSYGRADLVRRAMAKKKLYIMENERNNFIYGLNDEKGNTIVRGCVNNGIDEKIANEIFDEMSNFASYAFNKSHAAGYAVLAYQTAYLNFY
ncbi:MAG: DNA polymerase III subunit alpha, partial [Oscillospiraceae bacterium]